MRDKVVYVGNTGRSIINVDWKERVNHPEEPSFQPNFYTGLAINGFSFLKQKDISAQVNRNPDNGGNSKVGLIEIQVN